MRLSLEEQCRAHYTSGQERIFNLALESALQQLSAEEINEYIEKDLLLYYKTYPRVLKLYEDVSPFFELIESLNMQKGLLTLGNPINQLSKLHSLGIYFRFDAIEITGNYPKEQWKPSPFLFQRLLERLEVSAEEAIYVGDDLERDSGALSAGINFYCIDRERKYTWSDHQEITFISSLEELSERVVSSQKGKPVS